MSHEKSFWPIANPIIVNEKSYCILMSSCLGQRKFSVNEKSYRILMSPCLGQRKSSSTRNRQSRNHIIFWCLGQRYHLPGEHHRQREMGNPNNICLEKSSSTRNRQSRKHLPREIIVNKELVIEKPCRIMMSSETWNRSGSMCTCKLVVRQSSQSTPFVSN